MMACAGDNTDGAGLVADLKAHGVTLADNRILLRAGGARDAAPLLAEQPDDWSWPAVPCQGGQLAAEFRIWGVSAQPASSWGAVRSPSSIPPPPVCR